MTPADQALLDAAARLGCEHAAPSAQDRAIAQNAEAQVVAALGDHEHMVRRSPLGPGWSSDLDVHLQSLPDPASLEARGWRSLDGLLRRLGRTGTGRWAVVDDGRVVAAVDLHLDPPPTPVDAVVSRARRRGEVSAREVLELRVLQRAGERLPPGNAVVTTAADLERMLGGDELSAWATGRATTCPAPVRRRGLADLRALAGRVRYRMKPRLVVALSGVDGAGKSTLAHELDEALRRAGVPCSHVWARPGLGLRGLDTVARLGKRLLREDPEPGVRRVAADQPVAVRSRQGLVGWAWALLVTLSFLGSAWRQHLRGQGVVIYDRHLLDGLASMEVLYHGSDQRLQHALIRSCLPRAAASFYLDLPADVAVSRKPGDSIGARAVEAQLEHYRRLLAGADAVVVLDATRPSRELALAVLDHLCGSFARSEN